MKKSNLKTIFLSLLSRRFRRAGDAPVTEAMAGADLRVRPPENTVGADLHVRPSENTVGADLHVRPSENTVGADLHVRPSENTVGADLRVRPSENTVGADLRVCPPENVVGADLRVCLPENMVGADLSICPGSDSRATAEAVSGTGDRLTTKPPGPPADWLAKRSSGPPPHWVELARQSAPGPLQNWKNDKVVATPRPQPPKKLQRKPATLRLEKPRSPRIASTDLRQEPIVETMFRPDNFPRPDRQEHEAPLPSTSGDGQKRFSGTEEKLSKAESKQLTEILSASGMQELDTALGASLDSAPVLANQPPPPFLAEVGRNKDGYPSDVQLPSSKGYADPIYSGFQLAATDQCGGGPVSLPQSRNNAPTEPGQTHRSAPSLEAGARVMRASNRGPLNAQAPDELRIRRLKQPEPLGDAVNTTYRQATKREEEVTKPIGPSAAQDRPAVSYDVSTDRWPALFEASEDDYFDDAMAAWRELSHRRRLAREQAGSLWNE